MLASIQSLKSEDRANGDSVCSTLTVPNINSSSGSCGLPKSVTFTRPISCNIIVHTVRSESLAH